MEMEHTRFFHKFFYWRKTNGKKIKGKELGNVIYQRANGTYEARYIDRFGKQRSVYGKTITEVGKNSERKSLKMRSKSIS